MKHSVSCEPTRRLLVTLLAATLLACGEGIPGQHGPTKAIIEDAFNFSSGGFGGYVDSPIYPVGIPYTFYDTTYSAIVTASNPTKDPFAFLGVVFFGGEGALPVGCGVSNCTNGHDQTFSQWQTDPHGFKISAPSGNYVVARSGTTLLRQDYLDVYGKFWYQSTSYNFLGEATLPWRFYASTSNMAASSNAVFPGEGFWLQATAQLPTPITYAWTVDDVPQSWNGSFVNTSLTGHGYRTISATLTGSNSAQAVVSWTIFIKCPPPDPAFADQCS
jgi:hypothetical protein